MFGAIYLPDFHLQTVLQLQDDLDGKPVAVTSEADGKGLILELNERARKAGVHPGMTFSQGLGRCPELVLSRCDAVREGCVHSILLEVAHSLSPWVEATQMGLCTVDLRGVNVKDWSVWGNAVVQKLAVFRLNGRIGVAPNPDLAWLAAQRADPLLVVQAPELFLDELAVAAIDPSPDLLGVLQSWGIHTLGELTRLPRGEISNRLGWEADQLWQRAAGKEERLLKLVRPVEEFVEAMDFEVEMETLQPLLFILRRFLDQLAARLENAHRVVARMTLCLFLENQTCYDRIFTIPSPTAETGVLFRILETHLEGLQLEQRPVGIRLLLEPVRPDHSQQRLFENPLRDPNRFGETVARLIALVGTGNVGVPCLGNSHRPDDFQLLEPGFHKLKSPAPTLSKPTIGLPLRRYRPPLPARIYLTGCRPVHVVSETLQGSVLEALGPYRLSSDWWDEAAWEKEEWDVEIAHAGLYRISQQNAGEWWIEGCYEACLH